MLVYEAEKIARDIKKAIMHANNDQDYPRVRHLKEKRRQLIIKINNAKRDSDDRSTPPPLGKHGIKFY